MKRTGLILSLLLLMLGACRGEPEAAAISSSVTGDTFLPVASTPVALSVAELAEMPEAYTGSFVQVTGRYRRPPLLVCEGEVRRGPATWALTDGDHVINATGFEELVNSLLPRDLTMTVRGHWQNWRGPVGCGKEAPVQQVWYLAVREIVSPSPIVRVTLTPSGPSTIVELPASATPSSASPPTATATATTPAGPAPMGTPGREATPTQAVVATSSATPTRITAPATATVTATSIATPTGGAATATHQSGRDGTATASASGTITATTTTDASGNTPTPTATSTATQEALDLNIVSQGPADFGDLLGRQLNQSQGHRWSFQASSGDAVTIYVAGPAERDMTIQLLDPEGDVVIQQNDSPAGEVEVVQNFTASASGEYQAVVADVQGRSSPYVFLVTNADHPDYYNFVLEGSLEYDDSRRAVIVADSDHYWVFSGEDGDRISIVVSPNDSSDPLVELWNPSMVPLEFQDEGGAAVTEELQFELDVNGLHVIYVYEGAWERMDYTISITAE